MLAKSYETRPGEPLALVSDRVCTRMQAHEHMQACAHARPHAPTMPTRVHPSTHMPLTAPHIPTLKWTPRPHVPTACAHHAFNGVQHQHSAVPAQQGSTQGEEANDKQGATDVQDGLCAHQGVEER